MSDFKPISGLCFNFEFPQALEANAIYIIYITDTVGNRAESLKTTAHSIFKLLQNRHKRSVRECYMELVKIF
jgi:hypothetical protein